MPGGVLRFERLSNAFQRGSDRIDILQSRCSDIEGDGDDNSGQDVHTLLIRANLVVGARYQNDVCIMRGGITYPDELACTIPNELAPTHGGVQVLGGLPTPPPR